VKDPEFHGLGDAPPPFSESHADPANLQHQNGEAAPYARFDPEVERTLRQGKRLKYTLRATAVAAAIAAVVISYTTTPPPTLRIYMALGVVILFIVSFLTGPHDTNDN
jgi:hypothetical protein